MSTPTDLLDLLDRALGAVASTHVEDNTVTAALAGGGAVTAVPEGDGWDVVVRDEHGSPTPFYGVQSSFHHRSTKSAALAVALAVTAAAERHAEVTQ